MKFTSIATTIVALCWGANQAYAQDAAIQGTGYEVGKRAVLHPTIGAHTGFISNVFYEENTTATSPFLDIAATISLQTKEQSLGKTDFEFSIGLRADYQEYVSSNSNITNQRNLGLGADVALRLMPTGTIPISVEDHFIRTIRPTNFESINSLARDINTIKLGIGIKPSSSTLSAETHFLNTIDLFESSRSRFANRMLNEIGLGINWQFLPLTKLFIKGSYGFNGKFGDGTKPSSTPIRGMVGLATNITETLTTRMHFGYGYAPYGEGAGYSNLLWHVEAGLRYSPSGRFRLLFDRDFKDSVNSNFYGQYMGKAIIDQQIEKLIVSANVALMQRTYRGVDQSLGGGETRDDVILSTGINAAYAMKEWLELNASYDLASVTTDYRTNFGGAEDDPGYIRHQAMAGVTAAF